MNIPSPLFAIMEHYHKKGLLSVKRVNLDISKVPEVYQLFVNENKDLISSYEDKLNLLKQDLMAFVNGFCDFYNSVTEDPLVNKVTKLWSDNLNVDPLSDPTEVMGLVAIIYHEKYRKSLSCQ